MPIKTFSVGELATSSDVNTYLVNPCWAMAAGSGYAGAASTTVTFPSGRFSVFPILILANYESTLRNVTAGSSSSFTYQNVGGSNASYSWIAVQMTQTEGPG